MARNRPACGNRRRSRRSDPWRDLDEPRGGIQDGGHRSPGGSRKEQGRQASPGWVARICGHSAKLLSRDEEELRNSEKQLKEQASKLSETEKKDKETSFRSKIQDYQKRAQEFNQELQGKQKELVDDYMKKIAVATQTVADKAGYHLVLDKGSEQTVKIVIFNKDTIDLTEQVIKEFDRTNK